MQKAANSDHVYWCRRNIEGKTDIAVANGVIGMLDELQTVSYGGRARKLVYRLHVRNRSGLAFAGTPSQRPRV